MRPFLFAICMRSQKIHLFPTLPLPLSLKLSQYLYQTLSIFAPGLLPNLYMQSLQKIMLWYPPVWFIQNTQNHGTKFQVQPFERAALAYMHDAQIDNCNCRDDCNCIDHEAHFSWQPMNWQLSNIFVAIRLFSWFAEDEYKTFVECLNWILNCVYLSTCVIEFLWYLDWLPCKEISARNGKSGEALKDPIAHSVPPPSWNVTKRGCKKGGVQIA